MTAADDYCRNKVALPGSSLYYSVLFSASGLRASLVALHALDEELRDVAQGRGDEGVMRAKLGWWAEEIAHAAAGEPRHPVTRALAGPLAEHGIDGARFTAVLEAAGAHGALVRAGGYAALGPLEAHAARMAEMTGCMAAELCGYRDPRTPEISRSLGVGLALADLLPPPRAPGMAATTALAPESLARCAHGHLSRYLEEVPEVDRAAQRPRRALAEMSLARLDASSRAGFKHGTRPVAPTPLRKLWIAWKHRHS